MAPHSPVTRRTEPMSAQNPPPTGVTLPPVPQNLPTTVLNGGAHL